MVDTLKLFAKLALDAGKHEHFEHISHKLIEAQVRIAVAQILADSGDAEGAANELRAILGPGPGEPGRDAKRRDGPGPDREARQDVKRPGPGGLEDLRAAHGKATQEMERIERAIGELKERIGSGKMPEDEVAPAKDKVHELVRRLEEVRARAKGLEAHAHELAQQGRPDDRAPLVREADEIRHHLKEIEAAKNELRQAIEAKGKNPEARERLERFEEKQAALKARLEELEREIKGKREDGDRKGPSRKMVNPFGPLFRLVICR